MLLLVTSISQSFMTAFSIQYHIISCDWWLCQLKLFAPERGSTFGRTQISTGVAASMRNVPTLSEFAAALNHYISTHSLALFPISSGPQMKVMMGCTKSCFIIVSLDYFVHLSGFYPGAYRETHLGLGLSSDIIDTISNHF